MLGISLCREDEIKTYLIMGAAVHSAQYYHTMMGLELE